MVIEFDYKSFLSNFYSTDIEYEGYKYMNAEACYHAQKCQDNDVKKSFMTLSARDAWHKGRNRESVELRLDWESVKLSIMEQIVRNKFTQNLELAQRLINTGDAELVEIVGDRFWGRIDGEGQNNLGSILMKIREELKKSDVLKAYIDAQLLQDKFIKELALQVYEDQLNENMQSEFESDERKLAYLIMTQRYRNLCEFLGRQKNKYNLHPSDIESLKNNWFLYNDLRELHFVGTDIYSDAMFIKHKVPFLYRSVGKDAVKESVLEGTTSFNEIGYTIFKECLEQIKSGGKGKLFSYSKCFGKMLIKYANIRTGETTTIIEIRKESWVNVITRKSGEVMSIQEFIRDALKNGKDVEIPLFTIDMSNARENSVNNLKAWINDFLGEQTYTKRYNDIYDPIGDAEVVSDFTGEIAGEAGSAVMCSEEKRYDLNVEEFCSLLYEYAIKFSERRRITYFQTFVETSLKSMPANSEYYAFYSNIMEKKFVNIDYQKIAALLECIDWDKEAFYMSRVKEEKRESDGNIPSIDIYKEDSSETKSRIWKEIVFEGLRGKYSSINCSALQ